MIQSMYLTLNLSNCELIFDNSTENPPIQGKLNPVSPEILIACQPPKTNGSIIEFKESIEKFISNEKYFNSCMDDHVVISIGFLQVLNSKILHLIKDKEDWKPEEYRDFF